MEMHKVFIVTAIFLSSLLTSAEAHDGKTYTASLTGIDCTGCKKTIAKSIGKLKGVKTIRIVKKSSNVHPLHVVTDGSNPISKDQAIKALGKNVEHYQIKTWSVAHSH
jgi:copper chaperone CopZ